MGDLIDAAKVGDYNRIGKILEADSSISIEECNEAFVEACAQGHEIAVKRLAWDKRIDPSYESSKGFYEACAKGHANIVKFILKDKRIDPSEFYSMSLQFAVQNGHDDVIKVLLEDGRVNSNVADSRALIYACTKNKIDILKLLLQDPKCNFKMPENLLQKIIKNIIDIVIKEDNSEILELIMKNPGIDTKIKNEFEKLLIAFKSGDSSYIKRLKEENLKLSIAMQYPFFIEKNHQMIFVKQPKDKDKQNHYESIDDYICIHNNNQYISDSHAKKNHYKGKPLYLEESENTPIGYNIHLPPSGNPSAILIEVYGGFQKADRSTNASSPSSLHNYEKYLMNHGVAIIRLNLPDLLELDVPQSQMPEELHRKIQDCIHKFYQTLTENPEKLHTRLKEINTDKIYLGGSSFGGLISVRHAQMYPNDFSGYISIDGALSSEMAAKSDLPIIGVRKKENDYLDPSDLEEMKNIVKPVLVSHNRDDNNVNIKQATDFYKKMIKLGKSDLVRLSTIESSNTNAKEHHNKGHFPPTNKKDFILFAENILRFMQHGPSILSEISELEAYRTDKLANKHYVSGTLFQKFNAEALEKFEQSLLPYKKLNPKEVESFEIKNMVDASWDKVYKPLYFAMAYVKELSSSPEKLKGEIARLQKILSEDMIINTIKSQENIFIQFVNEFYPNLNIPTDLSNDAFYYNEVVKHFRETLNTLEKKDPATIQYFLYSLYKANPALLQPLESSFEQNPQLQKDLETAKKKLTKLLDKGKSKLLYSYRAQEKLATSKVEVHSENDEKKKISLKRDN